MKTRTKVLCVILILLVLGIPIPEHYKDGGTTTYSAIAYRIVDYRHNMFVAEKDKKVHIQLFPGNFGPWPYVEKHA